MPARRRLKPWPESTERDRELAEYALRFQPHCDRHLSRLAEPEGLSVLVVGAGAGTEMLWAIRRGAAEVVGIDIHPHSTEPLRLAIARLGLRDVPDFEMHELGVDDVAELGRRFDLVLSNNTFEHLPDVGSAFAAIREVVEPEGRVAIFTDPLFFSSQGAHLGVEAWAHLHRSETELREESSQDYTWEGYATLNRMTLISFLEAVRGADFVIRELFVVPDRELARLGEKLPLIAAQAPVMDLAVEGIGIALTPPPPPPASAH